MNILKDFSALDFLLFIGFEILIFLAVFILSARLFKKRFYISMLCNFEDAKKSGKKDLEYKTGYGFNLACAISCFENAAKFYKRKIKKLELLCFEKEILLNCKSLILECKNLKPLIKKEYDGKLFHYNIPKNIIECADKIRKNQKLDKQSLDYKVSRIILIAGYYYVSKYAQSLNGEKLKAVIRNFYSIFGKQPKITNLKIINGAEKILHLGFEKTHLLIDAFGNFAFSKDNACVIEFSKLNFLKIFKLKIDKVFYSDKCCSYYDKEQNFLKIFLDIDGNLVVILCKNANYKIYQAKISGEKLKFLNKRNFLHSSLMSGNFQNVMGGSITSLIHNNSLLDCGMMGACALNVLKGQFKAFKYEYLFKNIKLVTLFLEKKDFVYTLKILKNIKLFNKFNFEYFVIAISSEPVFCADENFKPDELSDAQLEFLKTRSVLVYQNKKIKSNLKFIDKISKDLVWQNSPFFATDNFRLNELIKILYGFTFKKTDSTINFCFQKICEMNHKNFKENLQNLIFLFRGQTLDGAFFSNFNSGFYNYSDSFGTIGVLLYLVSFINFYGDKTILEEVSFYAEFENFKLTASKTKDTVLFHIFSAVQNLLNFNENEKSEDLKIFVFKLLVPILEQKLRTQVLNYINNFERENKKDRFSSLYNLDFSDFKKAVLNLAAISEEEKFLQSCILKMNLTNKILGLNFNKNMIRIRPALSGINFNLKIDKTNFEIGNFGFSGVEIKERKYLNVSYISLDTIDCKISLM